MAFVSAITAEQAASHSAEEKAVRVTVQRVFDWLCNSRVVDD